MKEPQKIRMTEDVTHRKEPTKIPLRPLKQELFDDFGYVMTIENKANDENLEKRD